MHSRKRALVIALAVGVLGALNGSAAADDGSGSGSGSGNSSTITLVAPLDLHITTPSHITTDGGSDARLPAGWFLDEDTYLKLDTETKRLQDAETRLTAENGSLKTATSGWQPGWYTLAITLAGGIVLGYEIESHL